METLKVIRVTTNDKGCYVRDKSSFHVNMNGLSLNTLEKEKIYVKMEQFVMPEKVKKLKFIMNFGYDTKFLKKEDTHEYEINYTSMNDLCHQVNVLVYSNFIMKAVCKENDNLNDSDVPSSASSSGNIDANSTGSGTDGTVKPAENPDGNPDIVESPVVITGPAPVIKKDDGNVKKVDASRLIVNHSLRQKMNGSKPIVPVEEMFCVKYVDGRTQMRMADGFMFFASVDLMLALGFRSEVMRLFGSGGKSEADVMSESGNLTLKICSSFTISDVVHFLADKDRICHVGFKKLIEPTFYVDGNLHSILCSYDVEKKQILCNLKRLNRTSLHELQFNLFNNSFEPYEVGVCVKKCPISFNLVICKKL